PWHARRRSRRTLAPLSPSAPPPSRPPDADYRFHGLQQFREPAVGSHPGQMGPWRGQQQHQLGWRLDPRGRGQDRQTGGGVDPGTGPRRGSLPGELGPRLGRWHVYVDSNQRREKSDARAEANSAAERVVPAALRQRGPAPDRVGG